MLKRVIILPFFLIILAAFAMFWLVYLAGSRDAVRYAVASVVNEVSERVTVEGIGRIEEASRVAASNAALFALSPPSRLDEAVVMRLFLRQLSLSDNVGIFSVGTAEGEYWEAQRTADGKLRVGRAGASTGGALQFHPVALDGAILPVSESRPGYDPRQRPWYSTGAAGYDYAWTEPYALYSNADLAMAAAAPARDAAGRLVGVTPATLTLGSFSDRLSRFREASRGIFFITDSAGRILASSSGPDALLSAEGGRLFASAHPDALLSAAAIAAGLPGAANPAPIPDVPEDFSFNLSGERYLGRRVSYRDGRGLSWNVVTALRESAFMERLAGTDRRTLGILAVFLLLSLVTGWMIVSYVTKPLRILVEGADAFEPGGEVSGDLCRLTGRHNELGRLARSFMAMKGRLDESFGALAGSLREKEVLLKEVHHRVKNNLQIVSSILSLRAGSLEDEESLRAFEECQERIQAMALVHEEVYQTGSFVELDMSGYLERICDTLRTGRAAASCMRIESLVRPDSMMPLDKAIPAGLVVNELVTNAIKHAFPAGRPGSVTVSLERGADGWVLAVADDGIGPGNWPGRGTGIGTMLVEGLVAQTGGRLERGPGPSGGTVVTVSIPD